MRPRELAIVAWAALAALSCASGGSYAKGLEYDRNGQHEAAAQEFTKAIAWDPEHPAPRNARGIAYMNLGRYDEAIADFDEAVRLDPDYFLGYYNRGRLYAAKLEDYPRAVEDMDRCIELRDDMAQAYHVRGSSYFGMGEPQRACDDWRRACELGFDPGCSAAQRMC